MRVVVTGGAGYIGSTAVASLVERGDDVVAIDNLSQGHQEALPSSVPLLRIDICDRSAVTSALHQYHPDAVLHFAALTIAPESVRDPAPYWQVNAGGTLNVLDAMRDAGIPAIIFSSTAAVYGHGGSFPSVIDLSAVAAGTGGFKIQGQVAGDRAGVSVSAAGAKTGRSRRAKV